MPGSTGASRLRRMGGLSLSIPVAAAPAEPPPSWQVPPAALVPRCRVRTSLWSVAEHRPSRLRWTQRCSWSGWTSLPCANPSNVQAIVKSGNLRKADLHLSYHASAASLVESLASSPSGPRRQRAVFRVDNRPGGPHHAAVDIRREPNKPLTLIVVEPATMGHMAHLLSHDDFARMVKSTPGLEDTRIAVIDAEAQKSPADCVMFSMSHASKMHKEQATFDLWHQRLAQAQPLADPALIKAALPEGAGVLDGLHMLPASFYKHAHSLSKLLDARPELGQEVVGRTPDAGASETLMERSARLSLPRVTDEGQRVNNTSIEYKRHALLARTMETLAQR